MSQILKRSVVETPSMVRAIDSEIRLVSRQSIVDKPLRGSNPFFLLNRNRVPRRVQSLPTFCRSEMLSMVSTCALLDKKPTILFARLKNQILRNLSNWDLSDLSLVVNSWMQVGYLRKDFCEKISYRLQEAILMERSVSVESLIYLIDGFANVKYKNYQVIKTINNAVHGKTLSIGQWAVYVHSLAELNFHDLRLMQSARESIMTGKDFTAKDLAKISCAFWRLKYFDFLFLKKFQSICLPFLRDFNAKEIEMLMTGFQVEQSSQRIYFLPFFSHVSVQVQRKIAQFSGPQLTAILTTFKGIEDSELNSRIACQLPRILPSLNFHDIICLGTCLVGVNFQSMLSAEIFALEGLRAAGVGQGLNARVTSLEPCFEKSEHHLKSASSQELNNLLCIVVEIAGGSLEKSQGINLLASLASESQTEHSIAT